MCFWGGMLLDPLFCPCMTRTLAGVLVRPGSGSQTSWVLLWVAMWVAPSLPKDREKGWAQMWCHYSF